ncbi:VCBS repeat-containing protein [Algoriphagus sp.]|uniref:VCBS repeat-containing protein n=1 Tax=Algoriphagus sp. TaxID=1872435 RepID=UPI00260F1287|nr:VCBS repeat-containing protein [Algoriphagus sp.]
MSSLSKIFLILCFGMVCSCFQKSKTENFKLFEEIPSDSTGLKFTNQIQETSLSNILTYQYFYNGGGIAVGDINNDGFEDLYFTANQDQNKLFLNLGNLKFKDITLATGTGGRINSWATGAVMVDINTDGLQDIYLCYSGDVSDDQRRNQLFVNQGLDPEGIPYYKEMAKEYGLDDSAYSTAAYFSDLEGDGDLDLLLLNHNPRLFNNLNIQAFESMLGNSDSLSSSKIYRNDRDYFVDITEGSGLTQTGLSYGLGASISDFNGDGLPDIYLGNDYSAPDYLYINQGNGKFKNELPRRIGHTSLYTMGVDAADINRDGALDLITLDMLPRDNKRQKLLFNPENYEHYNLFLKAGLHHQLMRNMFQLNQGDGTFSEIGQLSGISATDWSWAPLLADFDNDGFTDLIVTNGFLKDFTNLDFINYRNEYLQNGKVSGPGIEKLIQEMPATKIGNYAFKNVDGIQFENVSDSWGLDKPGNSNGATYADLDNDGDLDLVVNNLNEPAQLFENQASLNDSNQYLQLVLEGNSKNPFGIGTKVTLYHEGKINYQEQQYYKGFQGNVSPIMHFGLGKARLDSLVIFWPNGHAQTIVHPEINLRQTISIKDAKPVGQKSDIKSSIFTPLGESFSAEGLDVYYDFKRQSQLLYAFSQPKTSMVKFDTMEGSKLSQVLISDGRRIYLESESGKIATKLIYEAEEKSIHSLAVGDINGDGLRDVYVAKSGYGNYYAGNKALKDVVLIQLPDGNFEESAWDYGKYPTWSVTFWDANGDGVEDIFLGSGYVPGRWPESFSSQLLIRSANGFQMVALENLQRITAAKTSDLDQDGMDEIVIASEFDQLRVLGWQGGAVIDRTEEFFPGGKSGIWSSLHLEDLDQDGLPELFAGNWGLNSKLQTTAEIPLKVYFEDFDGNGSVDPLMSIPIKGKEYPFFSRDELVSQMYRKKALFPTYESFSESSMADILTEEELEISNTLKAEILESVFYTLRNGVFELIKLPRMVQASPIYSVSSITKQADGKKSLLLFGNQSASRLKIGKLDANPGLLLHKNKHQEWEVVSLHEMGLKLQEDVRSSLVFDSTLWVGLSPPRIEKFKINQNLLIY